MTDTRKTTPLRDLRAIPGESLISAREIVRPHGPAPIGLSKFLALVNEGRAPQPVLRARRCTRWRWSDIRDWLDEIAKTGAL